MPETTLSDRSPGDPASPDAAVPDRLLRVLRSHFGNERASSNGNHAAPDSFAVARAPGRVNLLGGHTDYNDGFVLPTTIDRTVRIALRPRSHDKAVLRSVNFGETTEHALASADVTSLPDWARYAVGVAIEMRHQGHAVEGFEAAIEGDVPLGAGLSSSAALEVATAVGLGELFSLDVEPVETARLCQRVEQEYVGVECGIMDQLASRIGQAGHALFLDCQSLEHRPLSLSLASAEACLVVTDSGVRRELASSKYNERRRECEEAARLFRQLADAEVRTLRDVSEALLEKHGPSLPAPLFRRARHVVTENGRVVQGADLLAEGDLEAFGQLMNASHASLSEDYEVSCAELDALTEAARETEGVLGTRMTGAGFGGCTVTLARRSAVPALEQAMRKRYQERFERDIETYVVERNCEAGLLA